MKTKELTTEKFSKKERAIIIKRGKEADKAVKTGEYKKWATLDDIMARQRIT